MNGYAGLSTRDVAAAAGVPLSQIHYHFGSKQGLVLALFEYLNAQLLDRQNSLFGDPSLKLSEQWDRACDYLDEDIASGYVRVLQELIAVELARRGGRQGGPRRHHGLVRSDHRCSRAGAEQELGRPRPLLGGGSRRARRLRSFIGGESLLSARRWKRRARRCAQALRRVGDLIRIAEEFTSDKR